MTKLNYDVLYTSKETTLSINGEYVDIEVNVKISDSDVEEWFAKQSEENIRHFIRKMIRIYEFNINDYEFNINDYDKDYLDDVIKDEMWNSVKNKLTIDQVKSLLKSI